MYFYFVYCASHNSCHFLCLFFDFVRLLVHNVNYHNNCVNRRRISKSNFVFSSANHDRKQDQKDPQITNVLWTAVLCVLAVGTGTNCHIQWQHFVFLFIRNSWHSLYKWFCAEQTERTERERKKNSFYRHKVQTKRIELIRVSECMNEWCWKCVCLCVSKHFVWSGVRFVVVL